MQSAPGHPFLGKTGVKPAETQVSTRGKETFFAETLDFLPGERGRVGPKAGRDKTPGPVALVLEQRAHQLILGGPAGGVITGDLGLYALYGGLMAGLFEETGRFAAFQLLRRSGKGGTPQDALIYGAGHGGMEAVLLVGLTNVSNLLLSFWLNTGTLEQHMGQLDDAAAQALAAAVAAPPHTYLWGGLERIVAVAIHISLSVLVWRAVERRASLWLFPAAIALHAGVDACAILAAAHMPLAGVELVALVWAVALAVLARWIWRQREKKSL